MRNVVEWIIAAVLAVAMWLAVAWLVAIFVFGWLPPPANAGSRTADAAERSALLLEEIRDLLRWDLCSRANAGWGFKKGRGGTSEEWWSPVQTRFECHKLLDEDLQ